MLSIKASVAALVKEFHFTTSCKMEDIEVSTDRLLRSANGYPVKITRRAK